MQPIPNAHRAYTGALHRIGEHLDPGRELADVDDDEIGATIAVLWGSSAPTTFNRNRAAVGYWLTWCDTKAKWTAPALPGTCERRKEPAYHTRAVTPTRIEGICTRRDVPLRERVLWRMLYETASRATAVLELNVEDLGLEDRRAPVTVKGGDTEWIVWGRGTALLPRYLRGRASGPLFHCTAGWSRHSERGTKLTMSTPIRPRSPRSCSATPVPMIPTSLSACRPGSFEWAWLDAEFADRLDHAADTARSTSR